MTDVATQPSEALENNEGTQTPEDTPEALTEAPEANEDHSTEVEKLKSEAAQRRVENRELKDRLEATEKTYRALAISHAAQAILADPSELAWSDDLADDNGRPDMTKIRAAAEALVTDKPHLGRVRGDVGQGDRSQPSGAAVSISELLRQASHG